MPEHLGESTLAHSNDEDDGGYNGGGEPGEGGRWHKMHEEMYLLHAIPPIYLFHSPTISTIAITFVPSSMSIIVCPKLYISRCRRAVK